MINRREFMGITAGAGATLALTPELLRALQQSGGKLIQRAIPSTGEKLPVIGLTLSNHASCANPAALKEVLKTFVDNGGKLFDGVHQSGAAEGVTVELVNELGIQNKLFLSWWGNPPGSSGGPSQASPDAVKAHVESLCRKLKVPKIDLVIVPPQYLAVLKEMKKEGRVRYIGVQTGGPPGYLELATTMLLRNEPIDIIGINYNIASADFSPFANRSVEETILPLAQERKIGVFAYFPFGGANGASCASGLGLFARVANTPLPEWAAEFDAKTWAQFFLKYVISHPAITAVRVGTTKTHHMLDNIGGGIGRLPNEAMRKRMAQFFDALPQLPPASPPQPTQEPAVVLSAVVLDRYVGEYKSAGGISVTFRREGETLRSKVGDNANSDVALTARSETRFSTPSGTVFYEFQLDGQGKAISVIREANPGPSRTWLGRQ